MTTGPLATKLTRFTLDTNCIIAVEDNRPEARFIKALVAAHEERRADAAIGAISASERTKKGGFIKNYKEFMEKLRMVGMDQLSTIHPLCYMGISFMGRCKLSGPIPRSLELAIHKILFPSLEFDFGEYCKVRGLDRADPGDSYFQWRNAKCDVLAIWAHINERRDVFVTSDRNFLKANKLSALLSLGAGQIVRPSETEAYLQSANMLSDSPA